MDTIRYKAEWEEQIAILMAFPHTRSDWAMYIESARTCFINIIEQILCFENVILCVDKDDSEGMSCLCEYFVSSTLLNKENAQSEQNNRFTRYIRTFLRDDIDSHSIFSPILPRLQKMSNFGLYIIRVATDDTWARDFGGLSIESNGTLKILKFIFNGWGEKFPAHNDNAIIESIFKKEHIQTIDMVLEGGSIESNGDGVLLTNTQCLLEAHRNPHLNQMEIELQLKRYFGLDSVLWLQHGYLSGDDTDSHIDTLARFISADSIAYITCEDSNDEHYIALKQMEEELRSLRQSNGEAYRLIPLPFTRAIYDKNHQRLPSSYANFLFVNGALLVPTYNDENDKKAIDILAKALPSHNVIGIDCSSLILWHGSLHCVSMQLYGD